MAAVDEHVPSPAEPSLPTAEEFLAEVREREGRVYRMREHHVFCLTTNPETANWLLRKGGRTYLPRTANRSFDSPLGAYRRAPEGPPEWDICIHTIPVAGEETIWEAAGRVGPTVIATDYA
jgi:hypothetical protein